MAESLNFNDVNEARRKAVERTIKSITIPELKSLGEELFPLHDHPWRANYFSLIEENPGGSFYYATTDDRVNVLYCHDKNKGMWFLPGGGMGPLQARGLQMLKAIVDNLH